MKKVTMFKLSAIALALGVTSVANATVVTTPASITYATELFQGSTPNATIVTLPVMNIVAATPLTAGTYQVVIKSTGAIFTAVPTAATASSAVTTASPVLAASGTTYTLGTTSDTFAFTVTVGAGLQVTAGTVIATVSAATVNNAGAALGVAVPTPITVTATVTNNLAPITASAVNAAPVATNIVDATSVATNVATSSAGITLTQAANANAGQIDLAAATGVATAFTGAASVTSIDLGNVTATDGSALTAASAQYGIALGDRINAIVTAPAGAFSALGTTGYASLMLEAAVPATTCTAIAPGISASPLFPTAAAAGAATTLTLTGTAAPVSGSKYHLCMSVAGTSARAIAQSTPTVVYTLVKAAGTAVDSNDVTASAPVMPLAFNGASRTISTYVPASVTGYTALVRVLNTGAVAAPVTLSVTSEAGVTTTAATPVIVSLAAGATANLSAATIETNLAAAPAGTFAVTARPRVTVTAPTNGLVVQSFVVTPTGALTELSGQALQ